MRSSPVTCCVTCSSTPAIKTSPSILARQAPGPEVIRFRRDGTTRSLTSSGRRRRPAHPAAPSPTSRSKNAPLRILALGPFTNIAAALGAQQHQGPLQITMMGGAFALNGQSAPGNMGTANPAAPQSEFNVYIDPAAAGQV